MLKLRVTLYSTYYGKSHYDDTERFHWATSIYDSPYEDAEWDGLRHQGVSGSSLEDYLNTKIGY